MSARAPTAIRLARPGPAVLALGGGLKAAACATHADHAFLAEPVGDLGEASVALALERAARRLAGGLPCTPAAIAHDLHPDFHSTRFALELAAELDVPAIGVQHHHAHVAAVAAEHRATGPVLGLALDGFGLGANRGAWGGELLRASGSGFARLGHLRTLPLPGGDRAAREPWRMGAAALYALGRAGEVSRRFPQRPAAPVLQMLERGLNCPPTSSAGRWFDAAAALLGVCEVSARESDAPMQLEALAAGHLGARPLEGGWRITNDVLDLLPTLDWAAGCRDPARGAAVFHATFAAALADWALRAAHASGLGRVALGGGCFANRLLAEPLRARLAHEGLEVLQARAAPPGDAGLALGQAAVARAHLGG